MVPSIPAAYSLVLTSGTRRSFLSDSFISHVKWFLSAFVRTCHEAHDGNEMMKCFQVFSPDQQTDLRRRMHHFKNLLVGFWRTRIQ